MAKAYLPFYFDWREPIALLSDAECGRLLKSLLEYGETGATEELSGNEKFLFALMKQQIDKDAEAYAKKCQQNKINRSASYEKERKSTTDDGRQRSSTVVDDGERDECKEKEKGFFLDKKEKVTKKKELIYLPKNKKKYPPISPLNGGTEAEELLETLEEEPQRRKLTVYGQISELYNEICVSYPKCSVMSEARKKAIKARFSSGYKLEDFEKLFRKAEASSFLKGGNKRNWRANFDWLIRDANMAKVVDGYYDDDTPPSDTPPPNEPPKKSRIEWVNGEAVTVFE